MTLKEKIEQALDRDGVIILPPMDAFESIRLLADADIHPATYRGGGILA